MLGSTFGQAIDPQLDDHPGGVFPDLGGDILRDGRQPCMTT